MTVVEYVKEPQDRTSGNPRVNTVVNLTDSADYSYLNTSSGITAVVPARAPSGPVAEQCPPESSNESEKVSFRTSVKQSIRRNKSILDELAK